MNRDSINRVAFENRIGRKYNRSADVFVRNIQSLFSVLSREKSASGSVSVGFPLHADMRCGQVIIVEVRSALD